jgi:hypothetical protein
MIATGERVVRFSFVPQLKHTALAPPAFLGIEFVTSLRIGLVVDASRVESRGRIYVGTMLATPSLTR